MQWTIINGRQSHDKGRPGAKRSAQLAVWLSLVAVSLLPGCGRSASSSTPTQAPVPTELVLYNWVDYMPQAVLDGFAQEYGIQIVYDTFDSTEEAIAEIRAGKAFDVAVVENHDMPSLVAGGLVAQIDYSHVPNFRNISANFRDLTFDPGNKYSVPYNWGTTGLLVRSDLVDPPVTRWADLWDARYAGKIAVRAQANELIGIALMSLGYPLNSEVPAQLEAAQAQLLKLKPAVRFVGVEAESAVAELVSGEVVVLIGWPGDELVARSHNPAIQYVLPDDGVPLWGDSFVISAKSPYQPAAELFINYLLQPEVAAQIAHTYYYATTNEAALPLIKPEIRNDPTIYPDLGSIESLMWYMPLSLAGEQMYADVWARSLGSGQ